MRYGSADCKLSVCYDMTEQEAEGNGDSERFNAAVA